MPSWKSDELKKIGESDELHVSPFRDHGMTYGTPTWIWSVVVEELLRGRLGLAQLANSHLPGV